MQEEADACKVDWNGGELELRKADELGVDPGEKEEEE